MVTTYEVSHLIGIARFLDVLHDNFSTRHSCSVGKQHIAQGMGGGLGQYFDV